MTRNIVRRLAFNLAEANNLQHPFQNGKAGYDWSYHFLQRHRDRLSVRTAQPLSIERLFGFRKSAVYLFFDHLEEIVRERGFGPEDIYNCDETGFTIVTTRSPKVFAERGARVVATIKPVERGRLVSVMACASAAGNFVPPFYVFPGNSSARQDAKVALGPTGAKSSNSKKGWMTAEVFIEWMQHFRDCVNPSEDRKVLLVLDNHSSHVNYEAVEFARDNHIDMVTLPPHTSHKLQPLDVGFFSPLKTKFGEAMAMWQNEHRYQKPSELDLPAIMKRPYEDTARIEVGKNSFRKTGIWVPFVNGPDRTVFHADEFLPENDDASQTNPMAITDDDDGPPGPGNDDSHDDFAETHMEAVGDESAETHTETTTLEIIQQPSSSSNNVLSTQWDTDEGSQRSELLLISAITVTEEELLEVQHTSSDSVSAGDAHNAPNHGPSTCTQFVHSESSANRDLTTMFNVAPTLQLVPYSPSPSPEREHGDTRRGSNDSISSTELQGLPLIQPDVSSDEGNDARTSPSSSQTTSKSAFTVPPHAFLPIEPEPPKPTKRQKKSEVATSDDSFKHLKEMKHVKERKLFKAKAGKTAPKLQACKKSKQVKTTKDILRRSVIATKKSLASQSATRIQPSRVTKK